MIVVVMVVYFFYFYQKTGFMVKKTCFGQVTKI
jgi:hypothetical protein